MSPSSLPVRPPTPALTMTPDNAAILESGTGVTLTCAMSLYHQALYYYGVTITYDLFQDGDLFMTSSSTSVFSFPVTDIHNGAFTCTATVFDVMSSHSGGIDISLAGKYFQFLKPQSVLNSPI